MLVFERIIKGKKKMTGKQDVKLVEFYMHPSYGRGSYWLAVNADGGTLEINGIAGEFDIYGDWPEPMRGWGYDEWHTWAYDYDDSGLPDADPLDFGWEDLETFDHYLRTGRYAGGIHA